MEWLRHLVNIAVREGKLASNPVIKLSMPGTFIAVSGCQRSLVQGLNGPPGMISAKPAPVGWR
jgi:hypothetical protein